METLFSAITPFATICGVYSNKLIPFPEIVVEGKLVSPKVSTPSIR